MKQTISRTLLPVLLAVVLCGGCAPKTIVVQGTVEATVFSHYAENTGKIIISPVEPGQKVAAGDVLAVLDTRQEEFTLEQLYSALARRQAALDELLAGADRTELTQMQNAVNLAREACKTARLALDKAQKDLENGQTLQANEVITPQALEDMKYQAELAQSALNAANLQLDNALNQYQNLTAGVSQNQIAMAAADLAQAESQVRQCEDKIARGTITALAEGIVVSKNYLLGDVVSPGSNLIDISGAGSKYVTAYWPADRLDLLAYGQEMRITALDASYIGILTFIDVSAEYTPKEDQTASNRNKTSLRVKILLEENVPLQPGATVTVTVSP
ncbi:MAG: HlyD family efflux transporter periplasmic adaptor subunit [Clostridiales Family XIII bacterium]|jgi:HlyD family secretion protein|nr:HlyD family efflux transporter periplasmic adaptor subunit [Clostridiales Family XIII bacterium]